jgi:hypothetical protein
MEASVDDPEEHYGSSLVEPTGRCHESMPNSHRPIIRMSVGVWLVVFLYFGGVAGTYTISINLGRFSGFSSLERTFPFVPFLQSEIIQFLNSPKIDE